MKCSPVPNGIWMGLRCPSRVAWARSSLTATSISASSTGAPGNPEQAREHLTTAAAMYREMDMQFWVEQAEGRREPNSG